MISLGMNIVSQQMILLCVLIKFPKLSWLAWRHTSPSLITLLPNLSHGSIALALKQSAKEMRLLDHGSRTNQRLTTLPT